MKRVVFMGIFGLTLVACQWFFRALPAQAPANALAVMESEVSGARAKVESHAEKKPTLLDQVPESVEAERRSRTENQDEEVTHLIQVALNSPDSADRADAFRELGLLDPTPGLLQICLSGLSDPDAEVRLEAILALEMFGDPSAIPFLKQAATEDRDADVRESALDAIVELQRSKGRGLALRGTSSIG